MSTDLVSEYQAKIKPILPLAKKAYGSRTQDTPAHDASREYTRLLTEFHDKGGSLPQLAKELNVAYAGVRRRVVMQNVAVSKIKPRSRARSEELSGALARVKEAKSKSVDEYHDQLALEYESGISLATLAKAMGLSSAAPLYYGVQRSLQRRAE